MKQVLQEARAGEVSVVDVPAPQLLPGCVLVKVAASLVSAGTERAASEFASKNLLLKAKARPDLVRDVLNKVKRDGLFSAVNAVRNRLDQPISPGYSSAGTVIGVGEGITDICVGDQVACAGAGFAVHAEIACVPRLLVAKIPRRAGGSEAEGIPPEEAAFTTLGAVALHGVRTAGASLGDVVAVIGLGLVGQLAVQILKAAGCRVLGTDMANQRAELARRLGADDACDASRFRDLCLSYTGGRGVDAVLIAAETPSSTPVNLAAEIARDRGTVVAVGTVGMGLERKLYYEKELDFRVSRSYGPGRYDSAYEQKGRDYPLGYVRWTETRNMEAFLDLLSSDKLHLAPLITHRFPVEEAQRAYDLITGKTGESFLGVLITYRERLDTQATIRVGNPDRTSRQPGSASLRVGLLGAGSFATGTLSPILNSLSGVTLVGICGATGPRSRRASEKFGFEYCTTDEDRVIHDPNVNTVAICTRHDLHAPQTIAALRAGKNVFCEKPLCLSELELAEIAASYASRKAGQQLMVGFNRRFAPMAKQMKDFFSCVSQPLAMHYRVNAGQVPPDHWVNDPEQGGGRILGEVCHFVDFLMFVAGSFPVEAQAQRVGNAGQYSGENVVIFLRFANGSQGTISYLASGDRSFSKERVEVFGGGAVAVLDDFRRLELVRHGRRRIVRSPWRQDKGHKGEWQAFADAVQRGAASPIAFEEIVAATLATLRIRDSISFGRAVTTDVNDFLHLIVAGPSVA